jgi:lysophospholipase L1-like esterase
MKRTTLLSVLILGLSVVTFRATVLGQGEVPFPPTVPNPQRFDKDVAAFEAADKTHQPQPGAILFVGDSAFGVWETLSSDLSGYHIVNRAVNSFRLADVIYYSDRIIDPYKPRMVVVSVGGNDVHYGIRPEQFASEFKEFVSKVRSQLPNVPVVFVGIMPTPGRLDEAPTRMTTNQLISDYARQVNGVSFIDMWSAHIGADGKQRAELWDDKGHNTHEGFLLRAKLIRPYLGKPDNPVE